VVVVVGYWAFHWRRNPPQRGGLEAISLEIRGSEGNFRWTPL